MMAHSAGRPRVTAAVLTFNGRALLEVVLASLAAQTGEAFETVVLDNGSHDGSVAWLRERWPEVGVVALAQNVGVAAALNRCVEAGSGEYVALLNNDLELEPDCLSELVSALDAHPRAAVAAAKLRDFHDRALLDGAGDWLAWRGAALRRGQGEPDGGRYDQPCTVFAACGAMAVYRRAALEAVGPFDEQFETGLEDLDWSFRAQLLGYDCVYVPSAVAYHMGSATIGRVPSAGTLRLNWRNWLWLIAKDYPASALLRHGPAIACQQAKTLAVAARARRLGVWWRAWLEAVRGLPAIVGKRRMIQRNRKRGRRELERVVGEHR
jgi:GT2 family glycosyltransferase